MITKRPGSGIWKSDHGMADHSFGLMDGVGRVGFYEGRAAANRRADWVAHQRQTVEPKPEWFKKYVHNHAIKQRTPLSTVLQDWITIYTETPWKATAERQVAELLKKAKNRTP